MIYEPQVIFNPNNEEVEFMYDHKVHILAPGEKRLFEGHIAKHAVEMVNAGLKVYEPEDDDSLVATSNVAYDKMSWNAIKTLASQRGVFKLGMKKTEVVKALVELDGQES